MAGSLVDAAAVAIRVTLASVVTLALKLSVALPPAARSPTLHCPLAPLYAPIVAFAANNVSPAGNRSVTTTAVAVEGPALLSVTVNATALLCTGWVVPAACVTATSASATGETATLAVLFAVLGSPIELEAVAVFVSAASTFALARSTSVALPLLARLPTDHTPLPLA